MLNGALLGGLMMDFFQLSRAFALGALVMIICTGLFLAATNAPKQKMQELGSQMDQ
jgi:predicted MFS family arabinose efflux permease